MEWFVAVNKGGVKGGSLTEHNIKQEPAAGGSNDGLPIAAPHDAGLSQRTKHKGQGVRAKGVAMEGKGGGHSPSGHTALAWWGHGIAAAASSASGTAAARTF